MHATMLISGMKTGEDGRRIGDALRGVDEVRSVDIDLNQQTVRVGLADGDYVDDQQRLVDAVETATGYTVDRIEVSMDRGESTRTAR